MLARPLLLLGQRRPMFAEYAVEAGSEKFREKQIEFVRMSRLGSASSRVVGVVHGSSSYFPFFQM